MNWVLMDRPFCTFEKRVAKIYFSWNWAFYPYIPLSLIFSPQTRLSWISFEDVTARFPLVYQCASHSNRFSQCWASLSLRPVSLQQRKTLWAVWPSAAADTCCFFPQISWLAQSTGGINNMKLLSLSTTGMWIEKIWLNFYGKGIKLFKTLKCSIWIILKFCDNSRFNTTTSMREDQSWAVFCYHWSVSIECTVQLFDLVTCFEL